MRPHDLLRLKDGAQLTPVIQPAWAIRSLQRAPFVVVRRATIDNDLIPVGIRGETRDQRHATFVRFDDIESVVTPESLATARTWKSAQHGKHPAFAALDRVANAADAIDLSWGPGGSVGFELATGVAAVSSNSDLDVIVYPNKKHTRDALVSFLDATSDLNVRVDIVIESAAGAVALHEWIASPHRVLVKTGDGPKLGEFSW
jgi:phosphoribosyl-dephospho-CoA transferase